MSNPNGNDNRSPASRCSTFSELLGTGYFHQPAENNTRSSFMELLGTGSFRQPISTHNVNNEESAGAENIDNVNDEEMNSSTAGNLTPFDHARTSNADNVVAKGTEILETGEGNKSGDSSNGDKNKKRKMLLTGKRMNDDFPPLLTSLNINGRPRFKMEKYWDGDRLVIRQVPNDGPEIVRSHGNGRVKMEIIGSGGDNDDSDDDDDNELNGKGKHSREMERDDDDKLE